jgi:hypothetical protein
MRKRIGIGGFVMLICAAVVTPAVFAQTESEQVLLKRAQLNAELQEIEQEIEEQRVVLEVKQREKVSLERDVTILNAQIKKAELGIKARNLTINNLVSEINAKTNFIGVLDEEAERERASLSQLLRKTNEKHEASLVEVVLGNQNISDFFMDVDEFESIKQALHASFEEIRSVKNATEAERKDLEEKRLEEVELRGLQEIENSQLQDAENEKSRILDITKGEEAAYQQIIDEKEQTAAEIRTALFQLRGSDAISFERALELAERAYEQTGVRPAFLLGIIRTESNLGANLGSGNYKTDMHPERDVPVFLDIVGRLGLNPDDMPVSKKPWYGWGGAMGPAQFIPSTWILYEDQIADLTGHNPPNPWDPEDAFMASAVLLRDNGAAKGGYANERLAALRYLAGWKNAENPAYAFYGDDVMAQAAKYQNSIDILNGE